MGDINQCDSKGTFKGLLNMDIDQLEDISRNGITNYKNGNPWVEIHWDLNDLLIGRYRTWYEDGGLRFAGYYMNGSLEGEQVECIC